MFTGGTIWILTHGRMDKEPPFPFCFGSAAPIAWPLFGFSGRTPRTKPRDTVCMSTAGIPSGRLSIENFISFTGLLLGV